MLVLVNSLFFNVPSLLVSVVVDGSDSDAEPVRRSRRTAGNKRKRYDEESDEDSEDSIIVEKLVDCFSFIIVCLFS